MGLFNHKPLTDGGLLKSISIVRHFPLLHLGIEFIINQPRFILWVGAEQVPSHHQKQWWYGLTMYLYVKREVCLLHYEVMSWKRFSFCWPFVRITHRLPMESPRIRAAMRYFDVLSDVSMKKMFSDLSIRRWFETPWSSYDISVM